MVANSNAMIHTMYMVVHYSMYIVMYVRERVYPTRLDSVSSESTHLLRGGAE